MSDPIFAASYMKLHRASGFVAELDAERIRYIGSHPATAFLDTSLTTPAVSVTWRGVGLLPGAIIGDAIHNIRVALDLMASDLAVINNKSPKNVYFPFNQDLHSLRNSEKFKTFRRCGDDCVVELLNIKPYVGANDSLRALHDLDVQDKHVGLIPGSQTRNLTIQGSYEINNLESSFMSVEMDDLIYLFPEGTALAGEHVIPTLEKLVQTVSGILQTFAGIVAKRG